MRKKSLIFTLAILAFLWSVSLAQAHMFWLTVSHYHAQIGEPVQVDIGFGHKFPTDEEIKAERLALSLYPKRRDARAFSASKIYSRT